MYNAAGKVENDIILEEYIPLVKKQAYKLRMNLPPSVELDDLVQAGLTGLLDAMGRFDASKGYPFSAFAVQRIRGAMIDELRVGDWLPRSVRRSGRDMDEAIRRLEQELGRPPQEREIANELELDLSSYRKLLLDTNYGILKAFEDVVEETGEPASADDDIHGIFNALVSGQQKELLIQSISKLPEREAQLLALYYQEELTLKEIGAVFEISEARVCQLHSQAVGRLRSHFDEVA
jgi:RNA polymerase sigma factor for flagellar operon FliA